MANTKNGGTSFSLLGKSVSFGQSGVGAKCLVCNREVRSIKKCSLQCHYTVCYANENGEIKEKKVMPQ